VIGSADPLRFEPRIETSNQSVFSPVGTRDLTAADGKNGKDEESLS
jgi:hypothetical protein